MVLTTAGPRRVKAARSDGAHTRLAALDGDASAAHNVAGPERIGSVALGAALITYGARRRGPAGAIAALVGGALVHRGATGNCMVYRALGVSTGSSEALLTPPYVDSTPQE
jgi:hypothetical protein